MPEATRMWLGFRHKIVRIGRSTFSSPSAWVTTMPRSYLTLMKWKSLPGFVFVCWILKP